jgi:uncharacterized repeat protein (TIGR03803 family)
LPDEQNRDRMNIYRAAPAKAEEIPAPRRHIISCNAPVARVAVFLFLLAGLPAFAAAGGTLAGHVPAVVANLRPMGNLPGTQRLNLAIGLPLRNREALTNLLQQVSDPSSPNYRHYLTPGEFADEFGPTEGDYQAVIAFAESRGLTVTGRHGNRMLLDVSGPVAQVERAFRVHLRVYQHPTEARKFYSPDSEPSVDPGVPVLSIGGLSDYVLPKPADLKPLQLSSPVPQGGSGLFGYFAGSDFRHAYAPGVPQTGTGQQVALVEFDGYYPGDVAEYESMENVPAVPVDTILLDGFNGQPGPNNIEVSLDIDMAASMAPGQTQILVYEGLTPDDVLNRIATDDQARQISSSWTFSSDATTTQIFQQFAAQGQSMFNASGDNGAYSGSPPPPTDNPYLTSVGGTDLAMTGSGVAWASEAAWPRGSGGVSTTYEIPVWQEGIDMSTNGGSTAMRNIPDVAMVADGCFLVANNGQEYSVAGTSIASPLWAAFTALINEIAQTNGEPAVGFINPAIYAFAKGSTYLTGIHDITAGNNESAGSPTKFVAVPGYDLCTGWGTPAGSNLMYAIGVPEPLQISPVASVTISGPMGGPFLPPSQAYLLTNKSPGTLTWALGRTGASFAATPTGGTLTNGGSPVTVTATPTSFASNAAPGIYNSTLWFTNVSDGFVQGRHLTLAIVTPPQITSQPTSLAVFQGTTASFSVQTTTNALLNFQWQFDNGSYVTNLTDGGEISGSATSFLTISNVQPANQGSYSVVVSNAAGVTVSSNAFLAIVPWRPIITMQPTNLTLLPGAPAAFSVAAIGTQPFSYQWLHGGVPLMNDGNYSGVTTSTLSLVTATATNTGLYSVIVSNSLGSTTSSNASLSLISVTLAGTALTTLHSFTSGADGEFPFAPLLEAPDGNYYGTTYAGGSRFFGTVFRMTTNGTVTILHPFSQSSDGGFVYAGLLLETNGLMYGATTEGGSAGDGLVYTLNTNGTLIHLASIDPNNGAYPVAAYTQGADGLLYGVGLEGGVSGFGTVYKMATNGTFTLLYSFNGETGAYPSCTLVQAADGEFYGTAENGGSSGYGTLFKITSSGQLTVLHSFDYTDGEVPVPGLAQDVDGSLYGTTQYGGAYGYGTVFRLAPDGTFSTMYSFANKGDGTYPYGALMVGGDGNLYGTATGGGTYGDGTVFRLAPTGTFATVAQFDGYQGNDPSAALVQGSDGKLYGTTAEGGIANDGVTYSLTFSGALQITGQPVTQTAFIGDDVTFSVATYGALPVTYQWLRNGAALTNGGNISGSTNRALQLDNVGFNNAAEYSVIVKNSYGSVTSAPAALEIIVSPPAINTGPVSQTVLTGTTVTFSVDASGDEPLGYQWQEDGTNISDGGAISGSATSTLTITSATPANNGVYSVTVSNALGEVTSSVAQLTVVPPVAPGTSLGLLHSFGGGPDGNYPYAGLAQAPSGTLYGTAVYGGADGGGTVYSVTPAGTYSNLYSFTGGVDGAGPFAALVFGPDGDFYGATSSGGNNGGGGTIYNMTQAGAVTGLYAFTGGNDGGNPFGALLPGPNGLFYGATTSGGSNSAGVVFSFATNAAPVILHTFNSGDGALPYAPLFLGSDGAYYGTTAYGGPYGDGTVFKITTNGGFTSLHAFDNTDGSTPFSSVVQGPDGAYYGTTTYGGTNGFGTVFRMDTNGNLATLYNFAMTDGAQPYAGLIEGADGGLYGTTALGGVGGEGTVFRITTNGALTTVLWFDGVNGANPQSPLMQAADGSFYGTTSYGGVNYNGAPATGNGVVFKLTVPMFRANPFTEAPATATAPYAGTLVTNVAAPAGDMLTFTKLGGPAWLAVAPNGALSGTPGYADIGTNSFLVSLADTNGWASSATMQITVLNSPWITAAISRKGPNLILTWNGGAPPYTVQQSPSPVHPVWSTISSPLTTNTFSLPMTNSTAFYRILGQ